MREYLKTSYDFDSKEVVDNYDELCLWAAPFGLTMLDALTYKNNMRVLDIGCGVGFPLVELAQRLGSNSKIYGIDPWEKGLEKAKHKAGILKLNNIELIAKGAEELPFEEGYLDLIVSNNGLNNVNDIKQVLLECCRVIDEDGQLVFTFNLPNTMKEFYDLYKETLIELNLIDGLENMDIHINKKRKSIQEMSELVKEAGFKEVNISEHSFNMKFADGTSMLNYYFIKLYFMKPWINIVGEDKADRVFHILENKLNELAEEKGVLNLTIPYACFCCKK